MTDPLKVGTNQNIQQPQDANQVQNVNNQAPQEIAGTKPSKLSFAMRIIAGIFTLGISEGIRFLVNKFGASEPRENQVRPHNQNMVPENNPHVDQVNSALADNLSNKNLPENIKNALSEVATQYRNTLENVISEDIYDLLWKEAEGSKPLFYFLKKAIRESNVEVTADNIKTLFDNVIKEHSPTLTLREAITEAVVKDGVPMDRMTLKEATTKILRMPGAKNIKSLAEARTYIQTMTDGKLFIEKTKLKSILSLDNVRREKVFPEDNIVTRTVSKVLNDLKNKFKGIVTETGIDKFLIFKPLAGDFLNNELASAIDKVKNPEELTEQFIEEQILDAIGSDLRDKAVGDILKDKLEDIGIPTGSFKVIKQNINILSKASPEFAEELDKCTSKDEVSEVIKKYSNVIDAKLNEIKGNMTEMENRYLPQVNEEVRPIVNRLIHILPFENSSKQKSETFIKGQINYMKSWKNLTSSSTFKGAERLISNIKKSQSFLDGTHPENERNNAFYDNVFETFIADSNRSTYIFNGEKAEQNKEIVIGKVKELSTAPKDIQFITKLANQKLFIEFGPLQSFITINGKYCNGIGQPFEYEGGELVHVDSTSIVFPDVPADRNLVEDKPLVYDIRVNADKKTGSMEFTCRRFVETKNNPVTTLGTVDYTVHIDFTLSKGNADGVPTLDRFNVTQKFGNPF